jgi:hypothetical protein
VKRLTAIAALLACALSGAALAVSLMHAGPRGPIGPTGPAGPRGRPASATQQRYGVCWEQATQTSTDGSVSWITGIDVSSPQLVSGVYQCPQGETFVSIVPIPGPGRP